MLKTLMLRKKLEGYNARMAELNQRTAELATREGELETAMNEAQTEKELRSVEELVTAFTEEQRSHQEAVSALQAEIDAATEELRSLESQTPPLTSGDGEPEKTHSREERTVLTRIQTRAFGSMTAEQRSAFIAREDVKEFLTRFRNLFSGGQKRSVTGADLLIPAVVLNLLRENVEDYSKLLRRVRYIPLAGRSRMPIMGTFPEAVWTEACAALNELYFTINDVEVDGYKVGGYVTLCNATLEDTDGVLLSEIIIGLGASIGIAVDKAILFGTGVKMPLGIATRLAQTSQPSNYPENGRPWVNLSASNVITIPSGSTSGLTLFQQITMAAGAAKGRYSRGVKFWAMNEEVYTKIQVEAMNINAAGAIVSVMNGTMPVVGGDIEVFSEDVMPNNTIIGGYGDLYLMAERAGTSVGYSDLPLYIQDQTVVKGTARYDGTPVIPEAFVAIGIGVAPTMTMPFPPDVANPAVAALRALTIGSLTLSPAFDPNEDTYTTTTTNTSDVISAVPTTGSLAIIKVNGKKVQNGAAATWNDGSNTVAVAVTNGDETVNYAVSVTKS